MVTGVLLSALLNDCCISIVMETCNGWQQAIELVCRLKVLIKTGAMIHYVVYSFYIHKSCCLIVPYVLLLLEEVGRRPNSICNRYCLSCLSCRRMIEQISVRFSACVHVAGTDAISFNKRFWVRTCRFAWKLFAYWNVVHPLVSCFDIILYLCSYVLVLLALVLLWYM